jgi:hypothetical protein
MKKCILLPAVLVLFVLSCKKEDLKPTPATTETNSTGSKLHSRYVLTNSLHHGEMDTIYFTSSTVSPLFISSMGDFGHIPYTISDDTVIVIPNRFDATQTRYVKSYLYDSAKPNHFKGEYLYVSLCIMNKATAYAIDSYPNLIYKAF